MISVDTENNLFTVNVESNISVIDFSPSNCGLFAEIQEDYPIIFSG